MIGTYIHNLIISISRGYANMLEKPTRFAIVAGITIYARAIVNCNFFVTRSSMHTRMTVTFVDICK